MKMLFRSYLSSLRERDELDAILPDLLSELGYLVFSRPGRGTSQAGVDIAALGPGASGERKLYLFTIKRGDITRENWNDPTPQSLRASLDSIVDNYIQNRIPHRFRQLKIVVCMVFGGDMQEQVRSDVEGYLRRYSSDSLSFEEWNGDVLASMLMTGVLREDIMPKPRRALFQKAVAMVDDPDVAYRHFARLVHELAQAASTDKEQLRSARQMYIALWVLFVWARDIDNLEAPYQTSELVVLRLWDMHRPYIDKRGRTTRESASVLMHAIQLHQAIAHDFLVRKVLPHASKVYGVSVAVGAEAPADVNLKLFDLLGRIALTGLWLCFLEQRSADPVAKEAATAKAKELAKAGLLLIENNPVLLLPLQDIHSVEVSLMLLLVAASNEGLPAARDWLHEIAKNFIFTVRLHGRYPCVFTDYRELIAHPREASEEYRREALSGSTLLPLVAAFLAAFGDREELSHLARLQEEELEHCTLQLWLPDDASEGAIYRGANDHGLAVCDLRLNRDGLDLFDALDSAIEQTSGFKQLSAVATDFWPIVLMACRHFRLPVPPQFWRPLLERPNAADEVPALSASDRATDHG
jgi:hypothetical protein